MSSTHILPVRFLALGRKIFSLVALSLILLCCGRLAGQSFPVASLVQVADFSPNLEAYDDPGRVIVTLINTDERPEYEALLRFTLSGPGFSIKTREEYMPFPVLLRRNQPLILTGAQLRDYFDPANLNFEGQSLEAILAEGGSLGEGPVSLCVEVYDFNRFFDPPVSNNGCATGFMILHRPPILVEPGPQVEPVYPQQLRFQWQPQHAGVAARYTLEVYEDILPGMGDNLIVENTQPILLKEGLAPFYQLTPADPPLQIGSRYLVRVRAEDIAGRASFLNDGWSDIYSFIYGYEEEPDPDCPEPQRFISQILNPQTLQLSWAADPEVSSWAISGAAGGEEILLDAATIGFTLDNLTPAEVYTFNLCARCATGESSCVSTTVQMPADTTDTGCGPALITSWLPLDDESIGLNWNEQLTATGFVVRWGQEMTATPAVSPAPAPQQEQAPGRGRGRENRRNNSPAPRRLGTIERAPSIPSFSYTDSLALPAGSTMAEIGGLSIGQTYQFEVCKECPDGSRECQDFALSFTGLDDDCLSTLDISRTDSTDTSLSLSWAMSGNDYSADSSFLLIWQIADGSFPPDTARLLYPTGSYTISGMLPFRAYEIQLCTECTAGQPACRELAPFGGCPSDYEPFLVDLDYERALLGWEPDSGDSLRATEARYKTRVALRWDSLPTGNNQYFIPANYGLLPEQSSETPTLRSGFTYLAQIRTQCIDTVWSDWSEPVRFNTDCAVTDSLWLTELTNESATVAGFMASNAVYYAFDYRQQGTESWTTVTNLSTAELILASLPAETTYETRMRYWCSQGVWSDYTDIFSFTTLPPCDPPSQRLVDPILADAAQINWLPYERSQEVELRFRPKLIGYYYLPIFSLPWETRNTGDSLIYLSDLVGGSLYEYQLRSNCQVNLSEWTTVEEFALLCAPPEVITITDTTYESAVVRLSGLPPAALNSTVDYQALGDSSWQSQGTYFGVSSLQNLDDMTYYNVRSTATCFSGEVSDYSDTVQFRTPVKCLVPDQLVVTNLQPFSAQLDWAVTGTIDEWEVLVKGPIGPFTPFAQAAPVQQQMAPGGSTPPRGGINPGSGRVPGNISPPPSAGGGRVRGSTSASTRTTATPSPATGGGLVSIYEPPPYQGWHRFTVTDPTKLLEELRQNTDYEVVVRARCPEFGWTDYTDTLTFTTLKDCRIPGELTATEVYRTSFRANWQPLNIHGEEYLVQLESLEPLPSNIPSMEAAPVQQGLQMGSGSGGGSFPGGGIVPGGGDSYQERDWTAVGLYFDGLYRDSILTPENNATFNGLRANTIYRWRVKTRCDNYGWTDYSDWVLVRTDACARPTAIVEEAVDRSTMLISWQPSYGINEFEFKYKLFDTPGADWITTLTADSFIVITDLLTNQIYDYVVGEHCQGSTQLLTAPQDSFLMERPSINNGFYVCGLETQVDLSNEIPLASLVPDDTIVAFDFPIVITSASGGGGYFSGTGDIRMPYFNKAKFSFTFDNIFVNDEYRMVGGYLEATGFGVEVLPPWADSLLSDIMDVLEVADSILELELIDELNELAALGENAGLPPDLQQGVQDALDCFLEAQTPAAVDSCSTFADSIMALVDSFLQTRYEGDFQVLFDQAEGQQYGIDVKHSSDPAAWYTSREIAGSDYTIAYKSARQNYPEVINGIIQSPGVLDSVVFSQTSGTPLPVTDLGDSVKVNFMALSGNPYYLVAEQITGDTTPSYIAGMVEVVPYPSLPLEVVLIPLSSSAASTVNVFDVQQGLLSILGQAVVNPSVEIQGVLNVPGYDGTLDAVGSGILTNYSPEMRDIIDALENRPEGIDPDAQYLFLVDNYETTTRAGFMPRGRQFGFLYMGNAGTGADFNRTLAHELGHGAYVLKHSYDEYSAELPEGQTSNLMDVGSGTRLYKWQWDLIQNPVNQPLLPGDETGESLVLEGILGQFNLDTLPPVPAGWTIVDNNCEVYKLGNGYYGRFDGPIQPDNFIIGSNGELDYVEMGGETFSLHTFTVRYTDQTRSEVELTNPRYFPIFLNPDNYTYDSVPDATGEMHKMLQGNYSSPFSLVPVTCDSMPGGFSYRTGDVQNPCKSKNCGIVIDLANSGLSVGDITGLVEALNDQYNLIGETGTLLSKVYITDVTNQEQTDEVEEYINNPQNADKITLWFALNFQNGGIININADTTGFYEGPQKMAARPDNKAFSLLHLINQALEGSSELISDMITTVTDPVSAVLESITKAIQSVEIPRKYWDCTASDYNPILYRLYEFTESVSPFGFISQWMDDIVRGYLQQKFPSANIPEGVIVKMKFAFVCGMFDEVFETLAAIPMLADLLVRSLDEAATASLDIAAFFTDPENNLSETFSAEKMLDALEVGISVVDTIISDLDSMHNINEPCLLAHTVGRDLIFGLSFFIGAGEIRAVAGAASQGVRIAGRLANLKWIRSITGPAARTMVLIIALNAAAPSVKLLQGMNRAGPVIELVMKTGSRVDDAADLVQAVARTDIPEVIQDGERVLARVTNPAEVVAKPVRVVEDGTQQILQASVQTQQYKVIQYADEVGTVLVLARVANPNDPNDPNGDCNVCQGRGVVEAEYRAICLASTNKALAGQALNKICTQNNLPTDDIKLSEIGVELLSWVGNQNRLNTFYGDVVATNGTASELTSRVRYLQPYNVAGWQQLHTANFPEVIRRRVIDLYDGQGDPQIVLTRGSAPPQNVNLTFDWNNEQVTEPMTVTLDDDSNEYRYRFRNIREQGTLTHRNEEITHHVIPATPSSNAPNSIPVNSLLNMQRSITNRGKIDEAGTYFYYTLANAYKLHLGPGETGVNGIEGWSLQDFYNISNSPLTVMRSLDPEIPGTFTADHRRPMAIRMAGLTPDVNVNWVTPSSITRNNTPNHWWKMTTADKGEDIDILIQYADVNGQDKFCPAGTPNTQTTTWTAVWNGSSYQIVDEGGANVSWNTIGLMIPGDCGMCVDRSFRLLFEEVCLQAGSTEEARQALEALCTANPSSTTNDARLEEIATRLLTYGSPDSLNAFFEDLNASSSDLDHIANNLSDLSEDYMIAWEALPNSLRVDVSWLEQIDRWFNNNVSYSKTPTRTNFSSPGGQQIAYIQGGSLHYRYDGFGGDIEVDDDKATLVLGKSEEDRGNPNSQGIWVFLHKDRGFTNPGIPSGVINRVTGGIPTINQTSFLDMPNPQYYALLNTSVKARIENHPNFSGNTAGLSTITNQNPYEDVIPIIISQALLPGLTEAEIEVVVNDGITDGNNVFWDNYNLPLLIEAFERGDDVRLASDPDTFGWGAYGRELETIEQPPYNLRVENNYIYNAATATYEKQ